MSAILTLKCPDCGASLEISPDMDSFACGYCGSQQIVQRRGGTVSLKLVTDAIAKVQAGTDRTASELALQRLEKEIAAADKDCQQIERTIKEDENRHNGLIGNRVLFGILGVLGGSLVACTLNVEIGVTGILVGLLLLGMAWRDAGTREPKQDNLQSARKKLAALQREYNEHRERVKH
jgi:DNA-directed RNA polymerase subunit RPC12/RpoP